MSPCRFVTVEFSFVFLLSASFPLGLNFWTWLKMKPQLQIWFRPHQIPQRDWSGTVMIFTPPGILLVSGVFLSCQIDELRPFCSLFFLTPCLDPWGDALCLGSSSSAFPHPWVCVQTGEWKWSFFESLLQLCKLSPWKNESCLPFPPGMITEGF